MYQDRINNIENKCSLLYAEYYKLVKDITDFVLSEASGKFPNNKLNIHVSSGFEDPISNIEYLTIYLDNIDFCYYRYNGKCFSREYNNNNILEITDREPPIPLDELKLFMEELKIKTGLEYNIAGL